VPPVLFESQPRKVQQVRSRRKVPVRVAYLDMTEVCRQYWQTSLDVLTIVIPMQQGLDGKVVAKMPNATFSPECRVPENAERHLLGVG